MVDNPAMGRLIVTLCIAGVRDHGASRYQPGQVTGL